MKYTVITQTGNRTVIQHMSAAEYQLRYGPEDTDWFVIGLVVFVGLAVIAVA